MGEALVECTFPETSNTVMMTSTLFIASMGYSGGVRSTWVIPVPGVQLQSSSRLRSRKMLVACAGSGAEGSFSQSTGFTRLPPGSVTVKCKCSSSSAIPAAFPVAAATLPTNCPCRRQQELGEGRCLIELSSPLVRRRSRWSSLSVHVGGSLGLVATV